MTDAELVTRARQGDPAAFGELVDRHRIAVYRATLAALGSHADAEDAAQDAFVLAYRRLASFRGDSSFKTWLLTIAWHQAINRRRGVARMWQRIMTMTSGSEDEAMGNIAAADPTPEAAAADAQLRRAIAAGIRRLSAPLRDALLLAQSGEHTYEEIGAMLGTPIGTIKWRVSEARRKLRAALADGGYIDG